MSVAREFLTDEQVIKEIERLKGSKLVRLAEKECRLKTERLRKRMYQLRWLEKRGRELVEAGVTFDNIESWMQAMDTATDDPPETES